MRFAQAIQRDVDMDFEIWILREAAIGHLVNPVWLQTVRRQVNVANAIVAHEQIDNVFKFLAKRGFASAKPQIAERRCTRGEFHDLVPRQIALLIQFVPVKARLARGIAARGDEKNDRVQLPLAPEAPCRRTRVSFGETSL